jgi:hypothetical protein
VSTLWIEDEIGYSGGEAAAAGSIDGWRRHQYTGIPYAQRSRQGRQTREELMRSYQKVGYKTYLKS